MYKVICAFTDLQDNGHIYWLGDDYPREGYKPSKGRITELKSGKNKLKQPVIDGKIDEDGEE